MVATSRRCRVCDKVGAMIYNNLCNGCWQLTIDKNIISFVKEHKKKEQL